MKKLLPFLTILLLIISSCSSDDDIVIVDSVPTIENISTTVANIGDIITINGSNFRTEQNYTVTFNRVVGNIVEVNSSYLKVQIPDGATSGEILLSTNEITISVGTITINTEEVSETQLYAYVAYDKLVKLDLSNGTELSTIANIGSEYLRDIIYSKSTNEIIGQLSTGIDSNGNNTYSLYKVNLATGEISQFPYVGYESLIVTNSGNLYAYVAYDKIVKLDISNGTELSTITTVGTSENYLSDIVYSETTNEIIGQLSEYDENGNTSYSLYKINLSSGATSQYSYNGYESLVVTDSGDLYAYVAYNKIVKLDASNGTELSTVATVGSDYLSDIVYSKSTDEIIGQLNGNMLYKLNLSTGQATQTSYNGYESLITVN